MSAKVTFDTADRARGYVGQAIADCGFDPSCFDLDAIVEEVFDRSPGVWSIDEPLDGFWDAVGSHEFLPE